MSQRITIFAGDFEDNPSAEYQWVIAWLDRWKAVLRIANYSTGGWEHIWNIEAPEEAIAEVPRSLLCASEWSGWTVPHVGRPVVEEVLRNALGKRLIGVVGDFHVFEDKVSATPGSVWLTFEGLPRYRLVGASDGWHLIVDNTAPDEFDMQELGRVRLVDMKEADAFRSVLQQALRGAWIVCSPGLRDISGVRLDFETATVRIINWGDEMYIGEGFPADIDRHPVAEYPVQ